MAALPILLPADLAEIRENAIRIGLHNDEPPRCYCPKCVDRRNPPHRARTTFVENMTACGFVGGIKMADDGWTYLFGYVPPQDGLALLEQPPTRRYVTSSIRCRVCGAMDNQKYSKPNATGTTATKVCHVEDGLCDRVHCIRARAILGDDVESFTLSPVIVWPPYTDRVPTSILAWSKEAKRNNKYSPKTDPNTRCDLRYQLDRRGRRGIKGQPARVQKNMYGSGGTSKPSPIHVATMEGLFVRYAEEALIATLDTYANDAPSFPIVPVEFDPNVHKIVDGSFEESRHVPNYLTFKNLAYGRAESKPYLIQGVITSAKELAALYKQYGLPLYLPNDFRTVFTTVRNTVKSTDQEKHRAKTAVQNLRGKDRQFIEEFILKTNKQVAAESGTTDDAVKQKKYRLVKKGMSMENERWSKAIAKSDCTVDGVYAIANLGGHLRAYLFLPATEFRDAETNTTAMENALHGIICDILERRASKDRVIEEELRPAYREIYEEFNASEWRMLRAGKWYHEDQTEVG